MSKGKSLDEYIENFCKDKCKKYIIIRNIYNDVISGKITLIDPTPPKDFIEYLSRADYSLWLWVSISIVALVFISIVLSSISLYIMYIRYIVGSILVLFLPGYVTIEALYPKKEDLSPIERLALSIGLSLAITPLIGLILNYTPWGIRLGSILLSLSIYIVLICFIASYRKYRKIRY